MEVSRVGHKPMVSEKIALLPSNVEEVDIVWTALKDAAVSDVLIRIRG